MKNYSPRQRAEFYREAFPEWPAPRTDERWLDAMWVLGQNYRGSGLYGSYPPNYVQRVMSMFPDASKVLHLFSGSMPSGDYTRFDCQGDADVKGDAHHLSDYFQPSNFDLILSDPPYSSEDAEHYGTPMVKRTIVLAECSKIIEPGGVLVWLDQVLPMFSKRTWHLWGLIGIVRSTNHRFRVASIFTRQRGEVM